MRKKKNWFWLILSAVIVTFWSCSPFVKVYSEEEPGVNLYRYHTYNWQNTETIHNGDSGPEWLTKQTQEKIRSAVSAQMTRYGYKPCDEKPDLILHYHVVIKNQVMYQPDWTCGSPGEGGSLYGRCNRVKPVNYHEGTLIIDFMDTKTGNQIWRGVAIGILDHIKPEEIDAKIMEAAKAIFKKFPEQPLPHA